MPRRGVPVVGRSHSPGTPATTPGSTRTPRGLSVSSDISVSQRRCAGIDQRGEKAGFNSNCKVNRNIAAERASATP